MNYKRTHFDPPEFYRDAAAHPFLGDRRDGKVYHFEDDVVLAVNIAMATRRPLLVVGDSGTGKSSLAQAVASFLGRACLEFVVTSGATATDLLWSVDAVARLADAQCQNRRAVKLANYLKRGKLWEAFAGDEDAVLLVDEIDKADPDFPNDLLVPLGSSEFTVPPLNNMVVRKPKERQVLMIITSNRERPLAPAFLRRCVTLPLKPADADRLARIAGIQFMEGGKLDDRIAAIIKQLSEHVRTWERPPPSIPEFLDAVAACRALNVTAGQDAFNKVLAIVAGGEGQVA